MPSASFRSTRVYRIKPEHVLFIHLKGIDAAFPDYGSPKEPRQLMGKGESLLSACARPWATFSGQDLYPTVPAKAAALLHGLVKNHPFVDGNKRTALLTTLVFLSLNGYRVQATEEELVQLTLRVAVGMEPQAIEQWIHDRAIYVSRSGEGRIAGVPSSGRQRRLRSVLTGLVRRLRRDA